MNWLITLLISLILNLNFLAFSAETSPSTIVIFGATGDLTARKLIPALYNLAHEGYLSDHTAIIGFARGNHSHETFRNQMKEAIGQFSRIKPIDIDFWQNFENKLFYNSSDFEHDQGYEDLHKLLVQIDHELGTEGNRIYYLATQPSYFPIIIKKLHEHQLIYDSDSSNKKPGLASLLKNHLAMIYLLPMICNK